MKVRLLTLLFLAVPVVLAAGDFGTLQNAKYITCYDGDTCRFNVPGVHPIIGKNVSVRLDGIDTPEIKGKCSNEKELAKKAKVFLNQLFKNLKPGDRIDLTRLERGKYFRLVATIIIQSEDGTTLNVNEQLIKNDLAVPYDGKAKTHSWCPSVN
ncbi:thermonuclease family protein [bacterium]|nr:thermonuclease family protein [bacterium]